MRYSVTGATAIGNLEAVVRQWIDDLAEHGVDEVVGLSLYFTPRSSGRRVEFRTEDGEVVDHVKLEPVARKLYGGSNAVDATSDRANFELSNEMMATANGIRHLMQRWRLLEHEMAALIDSNPFRVNRMLRCEVQDLRSSERQRLTTLLDIDRIYANSNQDIAIADWLRGSATIEGLPGDCPLENLRLSETTSIARLQDQLRRAAANNKAEFSGETDKECSLPAQDRTQPQKSVKGKATAEPQSRKL